MLYNQLPPLNSVKAFDAVVRHGSISEAARVLCVSQSAVSRHVANLEAFLGSRLLRRSQLGTVTTKEGQEFFNCISYSLDSMAAVATTIRAAKSGINIVKVSSLSSFALRWLVPRLSRFQSIHPDIVLDISISDTRPDFEVSQVDCAIVSGTEQALTKNDHTLFIEELVVIVSPTLLEGNSSIGKDEINAFPLIHTSSRPELWDTLQHQMGMIDTEKPPLGLSFQDFYISIAACVAGSGVAIAPLFLVREALDTGVLVQLFDSVITSGRRYQLAISDVKSMNSSVLALKAWMISEINAEKK